MSPATLCRRLVDSVFVFPCVRWALNVPANTIISAAATTPLTHTHTCPFLMVIPTQFNTLLILIRFSPVHLSSLDPQFCSSGPAPPYLALPLIISSRVVVGSTLLTGDNKHTRRNSCRRIVVVVAKLPRHATMPKGVSDVVRANEKLYMMG